MYKRKITLYYHTGTGNTLKIAKDIGSKIGDNELISISKQLKGRDKVEIEGDVIGFIFPVYFARPPVYFQEFIEKVNFKNTKYVFAVANGGGLFGKTLKIFERTLKNKKIKLDAGFLISMPGNHPKIASMQKKTAEEHYQQEKVRVEEIAKIVENQAFHKIETNLGIIGTIFSYLAFRTPYNQSKKHMLDEVFWVDDKCNSCGICEQICPVDNIRLIDSSQRIIWGHKCVNCAACYHHCPQDAIQFGKEYMKKYSHPEIQLEEIMGI